MLRADTLSPCSIGICQLHGINFEIIFNFLVDTKGTYPGQISGNSKIETCQNCSPETRLQTPRQQIKFRHDMFGVAIIGDEH